MFWFFYISGVGLFMIFLWFFIPKEHPGQSNPVSETREQRIRRLVEEGFRKDAELK